MGVLTTKSGKSLILIDYSNLHYGLKQADWEIDFYRLFNFLKSEVDIFEAYHFEGYFPENSPCPVKKYQTAQNNAERKKRKFKYFDKLREIGFRIETKPISSIYDSTKGDFKNKCNFDVEITLLALDKLSCYDNIILFSGDGDFTKLIRYLKGKFKQTIVISASSRINNSLKKTANVFININTLKDQIGKK